MCLPLCKEKSELDSAQSNSLSFSRSEGRAVGCRRSVGEREPGIVYKMILGDAFKSAEATAAFKTETLAKDVYILRVAG